jgi:hypothetical protein
MAHAWRQESADKIIYARLVLCHSTIVRRSAGPQAPRDEFE